MVDTIITSNLARFKAFMSESRGDNVYEGYHLDNGGMLEMSLNNADTHELIERDVTRQNGLA